MLSLRWYNIALAHLVQFTVRSLGAFGLTYSVPIITRSDYLNGAHPSVHFFCHKCAGCKIECHHNFCIRSLPSTNSAFLISSEGLQGQKIAASITKFCDFLSFWQLCTLHVSFGHIKLVSSFSSAPAFVNWATFNFI